MLKKNKILAIALLANMTLLNLGANDIPEIPPLEPEEQKIPVTIKHHMSIEEFKNDALKLGQAACFFNTPGEDPYFNVIHTDVNETRVIKCGCYDETINQNRKVTNAMDLENITPLRYTLWGYGGNYKHDMKYPGCRYKSPVGTVLSQTFLPTESYQGKIFIDEYKQHIPMFWVLRNIDELRALNTYLLKNFTEESIVPEKKTLLILKLQDDPELKTVDENDKAFLETYFEIFPTTDKEIKEFFEEMKKLMMERIADMKDPKMVGETLLEGIFRQVEKKYEDFEFKKVAMYCGVFFATAIVFDFIKNEISDARKILLQKLGKDEKATSLTKILVDLIAARCSQ
jgi:hypothetical protein